MTEEEKAILELANNIKNMNVVSVVSNNETDDKYKFTLPSSIIKEIFNELCVSNRIPDDIKKKYMANVLHQLGIPMIENSELEDLCITLQTEIAKRTTEIMGRTLNIDIIGYIFRQYNYFQLDQALAELGYYQSNPNKKNALLKLLEQNDTLSRIIKDVKKTTKDRMITWLLSSRVYPMVSFFFPKYRITDVFMDNVSNFVVTAFNNVYDTLKENTESKILRSTKTITLKDNGQSSIRLINYPNEFGLLKFLVEQNINYGYLFKWDQKSLVESTFEEIVAIVGKLIGLIPYTVVFNGRTRYQVFQQTADLLNEPLLDGLDFKIIFVHEWLRDFEKDQGEKLIHDVRKGVVMHFTECMMPYNEVKTLIFKTVQSSFPDLYRSY